MFQALSEMKEFMIENSVPSKKRQKLMRNLRVSNYTFNNPFTSTDRFSSFQNNDLKSQLKLLSVEMFKITFLYVFLLFLDNPILTCTITTYKIIVYRLWSYWSNFYRYHSEGPQISCKYICTVKCKILYFPFSC